MQYYVLNLPRLDNRREHMKDQLDKFGITPTWVNTIDRETFSGFPEDYSPENARKAIGRDMGYGEIACLLSHLRAFQLLIESGDEYAVIMEDDIVLHQDPKTILDDVIGPASLVLGTVTKTFRRKIKRSFNWLHELQEAPYGAYCYAIHRKFAAEAIVHLRQSLHIPIDVYFRHRSINNTGGFWQKYGMSEEGSIGHTSAIGDEARMQGCHWSAMRPFAEHNSCPRIIHQIWIGDKQMPEGLGNMSWAKKNPGSLYSLWTEEECRDIVQEYNLIGTFDYYYDLKLFPAAADVARYCILHKFGGLYADADSTALRRLDINTPFLVYESEKYRPNLLCNGFIQVKPRNSLMRDCIDEIRSMIEPAEDYNVWDKLGPGLVTRLSANHDIEKLASGLFLPKHFMGPNQGSESPYCTHDWGSTYKA